ncbi:imidazole glycerol phosphate synthase subunit HisH [Paroceanicella profunda]|uniref:Imidazole glycerol phosphate synthase subunit HisH n=1 Tax=Paroceanicella profunda TaxID=2579971 RepID=A0A5B8FXP0_9RHOB|nr:imidazole glycerol phosphate synthase subunit HisH [Paroceanicella profunda]QDL91292.1 imidazole glycerol phosphate synthase subunit HisH [Paroceanicella profunda]
MRTVIVDYGSGNLASAEKSFQRMAAETGGGLVLVSGKAEDVLAADRIVLPGVGAFADCRAGLMAVEGMFEAISERVKQGTPFMGICVGMQLMATRGLEHGETPGFDWIHGDVVRMVPNDPELKIPHMGWNELMIDRPHPVFEGVEPGDHAYFVHSYHLMPREPSHRIAHVAYGEFITAAVARGNIVGTQFHPEKSQKTGLRVIANFLKWKP